MMRLVVDGTPLCYPLTGIGQYTQSLLGALAVQRPEWEFIVLSPYPPTSPSPFPNVHHDLETSRALSTHRPGWRGWWFDGILPSAVSAAGADVFWAANGLVPFRLAGVKVALTLYDFVPERFPHTMTFAARIYRKWNLRHWLARATWRMPISQAVGDEAQALFSVSTNAVIHPGVDALFTDFVAQPRTDLEPAKADYFVVLGTVEPRKNLAVLIRSLDQLVLEGIWPEGLKVRIVGLNGWLDRQTQDRIDDLETRGIVERLGYVPRELLPGLLANARALLMPSLYEGFGMPIAEAMAVGCPVICSDIPPFREIIGEEPALFHGTDEASIYNAYRSYVTTQQVSRWTQSKDGAELRFTWERSASRFIHVLENR
ncbi:MAG: glycosyltransferase family 4 protein [Holophagaceae bacterium]|uniref:Glycosyltransferase family 4 protein n=1 Tax=Candidatus Geothrix skivensis TaxID=2954439 RepID=A0A9D7SK51_9BACT|nr:glycosyltransferase family 4 protein [Candidatus Geothrix skivensis]